MSAFIKCTHSKCDDSFGHSAGDKVLIEFAALLKELFGDMGLISRYGGDEFLVFIKSADRLKIESKVSDLKRRVHDIKPITRKEGDDYSVSCSCGGAFCPHDARDFEKLKACADRALYKVKERGRDGYGWYDGKISKSEK